MLKLIVAGFMATITMPAAAVAQWVDESGEELSETPQKPREPQRPHSRGYTSYSAPYSAWRYRPIYEGYNLQPSFYDKRYYAPGHRSQGRARWIRYGDDLLLVNTRNGRVLQVRRDYFW